MSCDKPAWVDAVRDGARRWIHSVMSPEHFGLFRISADAQIPYDLQSSAKALSMLERLDALEQVPGWDTPARQETIALVQGLQDADTGFFDDPPLAARLVGADDPEMVLRFRRGTSKWAVGTLRSLGGEPLHPVFATADATGKPNADDALRRIREGDWDQPWGIGSHAGGMLRELFMLVEAGHEQYRGPAGEAAALVLSHQNPSTGMWGAGDIPLYQQISGALKVIGRFQFSLGFQVPHLDRLADSCIEHHEDGGFYEGNCGHCIPRNVAEMIAVCLIHSEYRGDELRATLASLAERYRDQFQMPDGGFACHPGGAEPVGWNGTPISPPATRPRGDIGGTNGGLWCLGMIGKALGWRDTGLRCPQEGWQKRVAALENELVLQEDGTVTMERKPGTRTRKADSA